MTAASTGCGVVAICFLVSVAIAASTTPAPSEVLPLGDRSPSRTDGRGRGGARDGVSVVMMPRVMRGAGRIVVGGAIASIRSDRFSFHCGGVRKD